MSTHASGADRTTISYLSLRSVVSPEDHDAGRRRYCGVARANELFALGWDENVRSYLGRDDDGKKRKSPLVNIAIRNTIADNRDLFPMLNSGIVITTEGATVDDKKRRVELTNASIINGAQTKGVLQDYFDENPDDDDYPSVNFELIVTTDRELIGDISIARNFQTRVMDLSIFGRQGRFDELEQSLQAHDATVRLRRSETDFGKEFLDTEKLVQVLTAMTPTAVRLPSAEKRKVKTPETIYRVYAYRHRSRCLKDFALVMDDPDSWPEAHAVFLDLAWDAWQLYRRLKGEQAFSPLRKVEGVTQSGRKVVTVDGVPDGIVFPMLSALSRFVTNTRGAWALRIPKTFPWNTLFQQAMTQVKTTAGHNPQTMGKHADCYVALHGAIEMYFAVTGKVAK